MNLIEAATSGKLFKRKNDIGWNSRYGSGFSINTFSYQDIIATDWVIDIETKLLSFEEIKEAFSGCHSSWDEIKSKLGFKE